MKGLVWKASLALAVLLVPAGYAFDLLLGVAALGCSAPSCPTWPLWLLAAFRIVFYGSVIAGFCHWFAKSVTRKIRELDSE
jgi:hypothetical protein